LASIIGSTTSLLEYGDSFSDTDRKDLLSTVVEEAQRLDRHIQNLLDMTRLGQGSLTLRRDWVDLNDIVSSAEERMRDVLKGSIVHHEIQQGIPLLWLHGVLIEQALVNLLDNAIRFSPPEGVITISAHHEGGDVTIDVCDEGPGVPEPERNRIFDMFYTIRDADRRDLQGTGLGLAICRGMVVAHGGTVAAMEGRDGKGACMRIVLPVMQPDGMGST
jgi:two-component system sensor histidine kinase KdpD